jgi:hypothetical protein
LRKRTRQLGLTLSILAAIGASTLPLLPGDVMGWGRLFLIETLLAPVIYTGSLTVAWLFARGNNHVFWLLLLAPLAFWRAAEYALVMVIWTLRGGMV